MLPSPALAASCCLFLAAAPAFTRTGGESPSQPPSAQAVTAGLAALGPRSGEAAQARAVRLLVAALRHAGLQQVRAAPVRGRQRLVNVEGVLPGKVPEEIVLSAHYDSVPRSPGADDDASGCGVAVAAAADLRRTPLRHTVRVVLFDGEEIDSGGSQGWLTDRGPGAGRRILANLNLEMVGWPGSAGPVIHSFPVHRRLAPGWLVHSILQSGRAVGWPFAVADNRFPLLGQLVIRSAAVRYASDSESFLGRGIPSVTLSDSSLLTLDPAYHRPADTAGRLDARRLDRWTQAVAAAARRLDALAGRPLPEDQYLALGGRVWLRRDLIWAGFLVWALLVFRGLPGRWRGSSAAERGRQMRAYLPGLLFRALLLAAVFFAPVFAVLLLPAAVLALAPPRPLWARIVWIAAGLLPFLAYLTALAVASRHRIASLEEGFQGGIPAAILIPAALLAWGFLIARGRSERRLTTADAAGKVET
ncbi:MAG TPA: M28 family metallopeptidase [Thermoanaerobaculia bacterium]|jgi:hypothetical protein